MQRLKLSVSLFFILFAFVLFGRHGLTTFSAAGNRAELATLSAPNGVAASDADYIDKVSVMWSAVRGATVYRIFRSTTPDPSTSTDVGTTPANYFFDRSATPNQTYFYWVKAENGAMASAFSTPDEGSRAVGSFQSEIFSPLSPPPVPTGNPVTAAKATLGKTLFWDEQLSSTWTVSCGTCHRPAAGGSDPRTLVENIPARNPGFDEIFNTGDDVFGSPGVPLNNANGTYSMSTLFGLNEQVTPRKAPSYLNAGLASNGSFWDGRASSTFRDPLTNQILLTDWASLESQVLGPPLSTFEMGHGGRNWIEAANQIAGAKPLALASGIPRSLATWIGGRTYPQLFEEAFGTPEVTPARIAMAIATHERTLFTDRAPLDRWASAIGTLTPEEDRGRQIFVQANCIFCHGGPLLSDQNFHNVGVRPQIEDTGRAVVTGNNNDRGRFKTPSLRNIELRAPYMHNGRFATLEEVVEFYNRGGDFDAPNKDPRVRPLNLTTQQKADLVAFLKRPMTDPRVREELPPFDRPKLYTESNRVPVIVGTGRTGSGGVAPKPLAIEPPLVGNPSFTIAVSEGLGNAQAVLVIDAVDPGVGNSIPANGSFARQTINLSGTGAGNGFASISLAIPDDPLLVGQTFYGRWYVTDAGAANGFSVSPAFRFTVFETIATAGKTVADFDGDGKTDISIFRPASGEWWINQSGSGVTNAAQFGAGTDKIVPGDYTGDGRADIAIWRPSTGQWFVLRSEDGTFYAFPFGTTGDVPVAADFDGDGRADAAVFRPAAQTWFINKSSGGTTILTFGAAGDLPLPADYDGDGRADIAVFRSAGGSGNAEWWYLRSSDAQTVALPFGLSTDKAFPADYTGDGKTDLAVWRPSTGEWFVMRSEDNTFFAFPFGAAGDVPAPGDYDGDGVTDPAVFRPSQATWYIQRSSAGLQITGFGAPNDTPLPGLNMP